MGSDLPADVASIQAEETRLHRGAQWAYVALAGAASALLWLSGLGDSLVLDETVTHWVIREGLPRLLHRSVQFQYSPVAFLFPWASAALGGPSEAVLRAPSLLAAALAAILLYQLGREILDREAGLLSAVVFCASREAGWAACTARPYALGLLAVIASVLFLVRWVKRRSRADALGYALCASATVYIHPLLGLMFLVHGLYALSHRDGPPGTDRAGVLLLTGALLLPLVPQVLSLWGRRGGLSYAGTPTPEDLFKLLVSPGLAGPLLFGLLLAHWAGATSLRGGQAVGLRLLLTWLILPPTLLFLIAWLTPFKLFVPHYALTSAPALALLVGWLIRCLEPLRARMIVAATVVVLAGVTLRGELRYREDWRGAAAAVRLVEDSDTPIVVLSGLSESSQIDWLVDPERASYLLSPFSAYPVRGRLLLLPSSTVGPGLADHVDRVLSVLVQARRFVLVARGDGRDVERFLRERTSAVGFRTQRVGGIPGVFVAVFERTPS